MIFRISIILSLITSISIACIPNSKKPMHEIAITYKETNQKGISMDILDNIYRDTLSQPVNNQEDNLRLISEMDSIPIKLSLFLRQNNFSFPFTAPCFQRYYVNENGKIDYWIYNFLGTPPYVLPQEQQLRYRILLNEFLNNFQFLYWPPINWRKILHFQITHRKLFFYFQHEPLF